MCAWGTDVMLMVPIPAHLSHTGEFRWDLKAVDSCIAPLVAALNNAGIYTASACCGHGRADGVIFLHDGRELVIKSSNPPIDEAVISNELHEKKGLSW